MTVAPLAADWIDPRQLAIIAAILLATIVVLNMRRRRRPLDGSPKQYRREIDAANAQTSAVKRNMEELLVELQELSRKISAQIDTKFVKLEQSIADADKRISTLRALIEEARAAGTQQPTTAEGGPGAIQAAPAPEKQGTRPPPDPRYRQIYMLADEGHTPVQIARELGHTVGEVELILNLRNSAGGERGSQPPRGFDSTV
jgi:hypothetical protein